MKVSVIVPFLDEERALPMTLACLARAIAIHRDTEVIAVDGGSRDASRMILSAHPRVCVLEAPRGRARQMNAGAAAAHGDVLLFLHADTLVPEQALRAIASAAAAADFVYGGFHHRFSGTDWRLRVISALHNFRCRITATFTSARKFEQMGVWTSFARVLAILLCLRFGRKPPAAFFADIR